jgi:putative ABC transport system ATP-binding protein
MIECKNLTKTYKMGDSEYKALRGIDLKIDNNELIALIGASGSGKTTTMQILGLLSSQSSGNYNLLGHDVATLNPDQQADLRNKHIGFIFQSYCLLPRLTALENVMLPTRYGHLKHSAALAHAKQCLESVEMLEYAKHKPSELSGGQQQRIAIARALVNDPSLILADEPTGALDSNTGKLVMDRLIELQEQHKKTVIIVTHDNAIATQCKRQIRMKDGLLESTT